MQRLNLWHVLTVSDQQVVDDAPRNMRPQLRTRFSAAAGDLQLHIGMSDAGLGVGGRVCLGGLNVAARFLALRFCQRRV